MKSITSIQEAQQAINELYNRIDTLSVKNWDRKQTRIVNAHPSVDDYDYVVRKELLARTQGITKNIVEAAFDKCTFGIGINSLVTVGTNVCPPYIVARKSGLIAKYIVAVVGVACTGSAIQAQMNVNGVDILTTPLSIPAGSLAVVEKVDFAVSTFSYKDVIKCDILQAGSDFAGSNLVIVMVFE